MKLTKDASTLHTENCNPLMKEIEEDTNKCKRYSVFMDWKSNTVKISILPKVIYRFNTILLKIRVAFFTAIERTIFNFV